MANSLPAYASGFQSKETRIGNSNTNFFEKLIYK
jgi:hypothetical protein